MSPWVSARSSGIEAKALRADHGAMNSEDSVHPTPQTSSADAGAPLSQDAASRLRALEGLRDELQRLHAELEFVRLMLKLRAKPE